MMSGFFSQMAVGSSVIGLIKVNCDMGQLLELTNILFI